MGTIDEETIVQYEDLFLQYMDIYRSHWRDDPMFDRSNTARALPHLPCPAIDREMLLRIAAYPVKENFILKRIDPPLDGFAPDEHLRSVASASHSLAGTSPEAGTLGFEVSGARGGQWRLVVQDGRVVGFEPGLAATDRVRFYLNSNTFSSLVDGSSNVEQSVRRGHVLIEGDTDGNGGRQDFVRMLEAIVSRT